jgi:hypothetical protein
MITRALSVAVAIYALLTGLVIKECAFLAPQKLVIWREGGEYILVFSALLIVNLFFATFAVLRRLALKNTGDKLSHVEKQLRGAETISGELTERILRRK